MLAERQRRIPASEERVWSWISDPSHAGVFELNLFHASAQACGSTRAPGERIVIEHRFGPWRELREARITAWTRPAIAWAETTSEGRDWFPHAQRLELRTLSEGRCELVNRLVGTFRLRGATWWLVPWYRHVLGLLLDQENRRLERAVLSVGRSGSNGAGS